MICVVEIDSRKKVRLGIDAPRNVRVDRQEIAEMKAVAMKPGGKQ